MWNTELETIAQRWADQCTLAHDSERNKLDGTIVGQNIYWGCVSGQEKDYAGVQAKMEIAPQLWYEEVSVPGFDSHIVNSFTYVMFTLVRVENIRKYFRAVNLQSFYFRTKLGKIQLLFVQTNQWDWPLHPVSLGRDRGGWLWPGLLPGQMSW